MQTKTLRKVLPIKGRSHNLGNLKNQNRSGARVTVGEVIGFTLKGGEVVSSGSDEFAEYKTSELRKIHRRQRDDKHKAQVIARNKAR